MPEKVSEKEPQRGPQRGAQTAPRTPGSDRLADQAPSHRARLGMTAVLLIPFLLMGVAFVLGTQQPATRQVTRSVEVQASPVSVRALLAAPARQAAWWHQLERVEPLEPAAGTFRQIFPEGRTAHVTVTADGPSEVTWRIADPAGPYRGVWRFEIGGPKADTGTDPGRDPSPSGTRVTLVEEARLGNPFARLLVAWAGGGGDLVDDCLDDLVAWFEQDAGSGGATAGQHPVEHDSANEGEAK